MQIFPPVRHCPFHFGLQLRPFKIKEHLNFSPSQSWTLPFWSHAVRLGSAVEEPLGRSDELVNCLLLGLLFAKEHVKATSSAGQSPV